MAADSGISRRRLRRRRASMSNVRDRTRSPACLVPGRYLQSRSRRPTCSQARDDRESPSRMPTAAAQIGTKRVACAHVCKLLANVSHRWCRHFPAQESCSLLGLPTSARELVLRRVRGVVRESKKLRNLRSDLQLRLIEGDCVWTRLPAKNTSPRVQWWTVAVLDIDG